jgi:chromosome partitioning protein
MATQIIAVLNQKGGVGKTTTCVSLGAALARRGQEVLLVDMDPQANLTVHVGVDPRTTERSTYTLLLGRHDLASAVRPTSTPGMSVVPSTLALANAEIQLASAVGRELILREALETWLGPQPSPKADFVIIDCPPSLGILTMNALCASSDVLLPLQAEFFALQGVAGILESLKAVQRLNRGLKLSYVVPCMVDRRKTLARDVLDEVRRYFGNLVVQTMIRPNVKLAEAPSHGKTIFEYDPSSNGAKDYTALAAELLGEIAPPPDDEEETAESPSPVAADETPAETVAEAPASGIAYAPEVERELNDAAAEPPVAVEPGPAHEALAESPPPLPRIDPSDAVSAPADEVASADAERPWSG